MAGGHLVLGLTATRSLVFSMKHMLSLRSYECKGLNGTRMVAAAFDPARMYR